MLLQRVDLNESRDLTIYNVSIPRAVGVVATVMETSHKSHKNATFQYRER